MKSLGFLALLLTVLACQEQKTMTYETAMDNCNRILEEKSEQQGFAIPNPSCLVGAQIPAFEMTSLAGKAIHNASLKGKPSIINFWFIACAPCVAEIPGFNAIVERFGNQLNYIAITVDDSQDVQSFLVEHPWQFEQLTDADEIIKDDFQFIWDYPMPLLLNENLEIIKAFTGGRTDDTAVQAIQEELVPPLEVLLQ